MAAFSLVLRLHLFLCCNPSLNHLILTLTIAVLKASRKNKIPLVRAEHKLGQSPGQGPEGPAKASNLIHFWGGWVDSSAPRATACPALAPLLKQHLWLLSHHRTHETKAYKRKHGRQVMKLGCCCPLSRDTLSLLNSWASAPQTQKPRCSSCLDDK